MQLEVNTFGRVVRSAVAAAQQFANHAGVYLVVFETAVAPLAAAMGHIRALDQIQLVSAISMADLVSQLIVVVTSGFHAEELVPLRPAHLIDPGEEAVAIA